MPVAWLSSFAMTNWLVVKAPMEKIINGSLGSISGNLQASFYRLSIQYLRS